MSVSLNNTDDDEYTAHWEQLKVALDTVLLNVPGSYQPISYEQMYSAVYKCVCKHFAEQLHADLCNHVLQVVQRWSTDLLQLSQAEDKIPFLVKTDYFLSQFSNALSSIVPLFTYLNRFYVESRLNTNIKLQLQQLFVQHLSDRYIQDMLHYIETAPSLSISPAMVQRILRHLYNLNSQYSMLNLSLFSRHVPGVQKPMIEEDLALQMEEDRKLQQELRTNPEYLGNHGRKRNNSDMDTNQIISM